MNCATTTLLGGMLLVMSACEYNQKTPSAPSVPDIALPERADVGSQAEATAEPEAPTGTHGAKEGLEMEDPLSPIAVNLLEHVPMTFKGIKARQRQAVKTAPIAYGFYQGPDKKMYNVSITGPNQSEADRRAAYHVLGEEKKEKVGSLELRGFKIEGFDAQRTYDKTKDKSEAVVLVNPFVEVKVTAQPASNPDEAVKLLDELDLIAISKLR